MDIPRAWTLTWKDEKGSWDELEDTVLIEISRRFSTSKQHILHNRRFESIYPTQQDHRIVVTPFTARLPPEKYAGDIYSMRGNGWNAGRMRVFLQELKPRAPEWIMHQYHQKLSLPLVDDREIDDHETVVRQTLREAINLYVKRLLINNRSTTHRLIQGGFPLNTYGVSHNTGLDTFSTEELANHVWNSYVQPIITAQKTEEPITQDEAEHELHTLLHHWEHTEPVRHMLINDLVTLLEQRKSYGVSEDIIDEAINAQVALMVGWMQEDYRGVKSMRTILQDLTLHEPNNTSYQDALTHNTLKHYFPRNQERRKSSVIQEDDTLSSDEARA